MHGDHLRAGAAFVVGVGKVGIARAEVHGWNAEGGEPGDVGPAVLGIDLGAGRGARCGNEGCGDGVVKARSSAFGEVGHRNGEALNSGENVANVRLGVGATARASVYVYNDESDVDALADALAEAQSFFSI
mgnify:CR=1 FL=1